MKNITDYFLDLRKQNVPAVVDVNSYDSDNLSVLSDPSSACYTDNVNLLKENKIVSCVSGKLEKNKKAVGKVVNESDVNSDSVQNERINKRKISDNGRKNISNKIFINECSLNHENKTHSKVRCSRVSTDAVFPAEIIEANEKINKVKSCMSFSMVRRNFKITNNDELANHEQIDLDAGNMTTYVKGDKNKNKELSNNIRSCVENAKQNNPKNKSQINKKNKLCDSNIKYKKPEIHDYTENERSSSSDSSVVASDYISSGNNHLINSKANSLNRNEPQSKNSLLNYFSEVNQKTSIFYDPGTEVSKKRAKKKPTAKRKLLRRDTNGDICLDDVRSQEEPSYSTVTEDKTAQLAPLFAKKQEKIKPKMDDIAKQEFLNSSVPDAVRRKMDSLKNNAADNYNGEYNFPVINHVLQMDAIDRNSDVNSLSKLNLKSESIEKLESLLIYPQDNFSLLIGNSSSSLSLKYYETLLNIKPEIDSLKKREPNCDVAGIYSFVKNLRRMYELTRRTEVIDAASPWVDWTEKYRPGSHEEILGNTACVSQLKNWIEKYKRVRQNSTGTEYDSENEFLNSDDNSNSSIRTKDNVAVLVGPSGCGKTCAVYTIARELGFEVLEINAGHNRNGKRILSELLESTRSHQLKHDSNLFVGKKNCKRDRKNVEHHTRTMSLILIEDADILFENYDEGYLSAINSLIELSKRPIIFTANEIYSPHIAKYNNNEHLVLHFNKPPWSQINIWLQIVALMEGVKLTDEMLRILLNTAGVDIRKNLLQLQMLISSKITFTSLTSVESEFVNKKHRDENRSTICDKQDMERYCSFIRQMSTVDIIDPDHEEISHENRIHRRVNSTSTDPRYSDNYFIDDLQRELYNFCSGDLRNSLYSKKSKLSEIVQHERHKKNIYLSSKSALSNIVPKYSTYRAGIIDYLPTIRAISRLEHARLAYNSRRTSRYFNYLKAINVYINDNENRFLMNSLT